MLPGVSYLSGMLACDRLRWGAAFASAFRISRLCWVFRLGVKGCEFEPSVNRKVTSGGKNSRYISSMSKLTENDGFISIITARLLDGIK